MVKLEKKTYSLKEIKKIMNIQRTETLLTRLTAQGYEYQQSNNIIYIKELPDIEHELKQLLVEKFNLSILINVKAFAAFFFKLTNDESYLAMPWDLRSEVLKNEFNIEISAHTLRSYMKKLTDLNLFIKDKSISSPYGTFYQDGVKKQIKVTSQNEADYLNWIKLRDQFLEEEKAKHTPNCWGVAIQRAFAQTKIVYYPTYGFFSNVFYDEEINSILNLCINILGLGI